MDRPEVYGFGEFTLDVAERRLSRGTTSIPLAPKAFDILVALVRRAGRLTRKRELMAVVWPDTSVEMSILTVHISAVRKALSDSNRETRFIETVSGSGYRFAAVVRSIDCASPRRRLRAGPASRCCRSGRSFRTCAIPRSSLA